VDAQDVLNMEWNGDDAQELDQEFQGANDAVEIDIDSDEDVPPDDSDEGEDQDQEICDADIYGSDVEEEDEFAGIDESLAAVTHKEAVLAVALSPTDRRLFATAGQDDAAVLWCIEEQKSGSLNCVQRSRLEGHTDSVNQVSFSHDGQYCATGSYDGTVKIWTAATGALLHTLEGPTKELEWVIWHPKGHAILAGSMDSMAWMWWAPTGKLMQIFAGHAQGVACGCWALAGKMICTGSEDRSVIVWNPRQGTPQQHIKQLHENNIICICSHPDAPIIVTGSEDATAKVVHIETGRTLATLGGHMESVECVAFSRPAAGGMLFLATASMDGKVQVWDGKNFDLRCAINDHFERGGITGFKWLPPPASSYLCTASVDRTLRIFNALNAQCLHVLSGHSNTVLDLDVQLIDAPDTGANPQICVISGSDDNSCKVFVKPLQPGAAQATSVASSAAPVASMNATEVPPAAGPSSAPAA